MDAFDLRKKHQLSGLDRSRQGHIDRPIRPLVGLINNMDDFYTTSSCSGRIMILSRGKRKCDSSWLFVTHGKALKKPITESLSEIPVHTCWFRQESFILHICARDLASACRMLDHAANGGLKHSGILSAKQRFILEIAGNERIDVPISHKGSLIIKEDYLKHLIRIANAKMIINKSKLKAFYSSLKNEAIKKKKRR